MRKDKNDLATRASELSKDSSSERHDQIRIIHITSTLRTATIVRDDFQEKHKKQVEETSKLYAKLMEMQDKIGKKTTSNKRSWFGF